MSRGGYKIGPQRVLVCWFLASNMRSIFSLNFLLLWWPLKQNSVRRSHVSPFKARILYIFFSFSFLFSSRKINLKRKCWRAVRLWRLYPLSRVSSEYHACTCIFPPCYPTSELESSRTLCSHSYFFCDFFKGSNHPKRRKTWPPSFTNRTLTSKRSWRT